MATHLEHEETTDARTLVTGILHDGQDLIRQHLQLFQVEIRNDLRRTLGASAALACGAIFSLMGVLLLAVMGALLIHATWPETIPLWGAMGIVGGGVFALGAVLILLAVAKFGSFSPLPDKSLDALKESFSWKTKT